MVSKSLPADTKIVIPIKYWYAVDMNLKMKESMYTPSYELDHHHSRPGMKIHAWNIDANDIKNTKKSSNIHILLV